MTVFFLIKRMKRILFESKDKVTLSSSKKIDERSLIRGKRNEDVRMCFDSVLSLTYLRGAMTLVLFGTFRKGSGSPFCRKCNGCVRRSPCLPALQGGLPLLC